MRLHTQILAENDCCRVGQKLKPRGIMVHSTGANNPYVARYVPGNEPLGFNTGGNHWNQSNRAWQEKFGSPLNKCVHAFVGRLGDGQVGTVQTLPWTVQGWHAGRIAGNKEYIGFEICEDGLVDREYFQAVYREAVELTAFLCSELGLDPLADGTVICHAEGYRRGVASNHGDVLHWFSRHGKTMDDFRRDVVREGEKRMDQADFDRMMAVWLEKQGECPVSGWAKTFLTQAVESGITDGTRPQAFATRQEVAVMVLGAMRDRP